MVDKMPNVRGLCKRDLESAATLVRHATERMGWIVDKYPDYPEFIELIKVTCVSLDQCLDSIEVLRANIP